MLAREEIDRLMERKRQARSAAIDSLHRSGVADGGPDDAGYWTLVHDLERAPLTTNLAQLSEIGVDLPDPRVIDDHAIADALDGVVRGLATIDVFLLRTDHLDDRDLYELLHGRILRERVREVPPGCGSREWIDLGGGGGRETWLAWYADDAERRKARDGGEPVPERRAWRADRDRTLPRPSPDRPRSAATSMDRTTRPRPRASDPE